MGLLSISNSAAASLKQMNLRLPIFGMVSSKSQGSLTRSSDDAATGITTNVRAAQDSVSLSSYGESKFQKINKQAESLGETKKDISAAQGELDHLATLVQEGQAIQDNLKKISPSQGTSSDGAVQTLTDDQKALIKQRDDKQKEIDESIQKISDSGMKIVARPGGQDASGKPTQNLGFNDHLGEVRIDTLIANPSNDVRRQFGEKLIPDQYRTDRYDLSSLHSGGKLALGSSEAGSQELSSRVLNQARDDLGSRQTSLQSQQSDIDLQRSRENVKENQIYDQRTIASVEADRKFSSNELPQNTFSNFGSVAASIYNGANEVMRLFR